MGKALWTLLMLPGICFGGSAEIHRCEQEDGTIAFQATPCAKGTDNAEGKEPVADNPDSSDDFFDFVNPFDEPVTAPVYAAPEEQPQTSQDQTECVKTTRDAIDAIDLRLRESSTIDDRKNYLAELLVLTRQLRACKQL